MPATKLEKLESAIKPRPDKGNWPMPTLPEGEDLTAYIQRVQENGTKADKKRLAQALAALSKNAQ